MQIEFLRSQERVEVCLPWKFDPFTQWLYAAQVVIDYGRVDGDSYAVIDVDLAALRVGEYAEVVAHLLGSQLYACLETDAIRAGIDETVVDGVIERLSIDQHRDCPTS